MGCYSVLVGLLLCFGWVVAGLWLGGSRRVVGFLLGSCRVLVRVRDGYLWGCCRVLVGLRDRYVTIATAAAASYGRRLANNQPTTSATTEKNTADAGCVPYRSVGGAARGRLGRRPPVLRGRRWRPCAGSAAARPRTPRPPPTASACGRSAPAPLPSLPPAPRSGRAMGASPAFPSLCPIDGR